MKRKKIIRIVAALLVALLALTLIPLGALAASVSVEVSTGGSDKSAPSFNDLYPLAPNETVSGTNSVTIKTSNYDKYIIDSYGDEYDLKGIVDMSKVADSDSTLRPSSSVTFKTDGWAMLVYVPHGHKLTSWISDGTTHWRHCTVCKERFIGQAWCQDGDEDGICNVCGGDVPYHDISVIESEGGKITVNRDSASHRMKITADVEPAAGYKLGKLHFTKLRDDGSRQEVTRKKVDGQFWTYMPTYELEVSAEFIKE